MLVPNAIKLSIINQQGKRCQLTVEPSAGVHYVKRRAIEALYASECEGQEAQAVKRALYFKLVDPATVRTLKDESKLFDEQITKDCDLLLVKKRLDESRFSRYGAAAALRDKAVSKPPDASRIREATAKLPKKGSVRKQKDTVSTEEFTRDIKRILVTLVESAQNILALNPEAAKIFKEAQDIMSQESSADVPGVLEENITQLLEMGFSRDKAIRALTRHRMSVNAAMEWLLTHPDEVSGDAAEASCKESHKPDTDVRSKKTDFPPKLHQQTTGRKQSRAQTILESFRAYKRRKFKPNVIAVNSLIDMGFEESDVLEALRLTSNDQEAACEWLLGDRNQTNVCDTLEDGIEQSSPLYQAIITNPVVQLGLSNPRCLLAFLHILENGTNLISNDWFRDPDVGPALVHISRIYQAEKKSDFMFPGYSDG